jgi:hypothetical protein
MYDMHPRNLYALDWALQDERNVRRLERLVAGLGRQMSEVRVITAEELPQAIRDGGWIGEVRQGAYKEVSDPDFLFTAFKWLTPEQQSAVAGTELYQQCVAAHAAYGDCKQWFTGGRILAMLGAAPFYHFEQRPEWHPALVCWSLHDLHTAWGCAHRCSYCQRGSVYVINLNVEEFVDKVGDLIDRNRWQKTFRYDVEQDVFAIEPEYGACELLVRDFARRDDQYLILFTKSANTDFLLPLEHNGHTMLLWTLSTHTVSRRYEALTGTMEERIEAARRCQQAGYTVRFKLKPIIPIRNWRQETTEMLELLYSRVKPDNLSMEMLFVDSVSELNDTMGADNLDAAFVAAARQAEAERGACWHRAQDGEKPFPFEVKAEVYRHVISESRRLSPETPVTLCAETQRMWDALGDLLDGQPWNYPCNCGPHCTPHLERITHVEGPDAERIRRAAACGAIS